MEIGTDGVRVLYVEELKTEVVQTRHLMLAEPIVPVLLVNLAHHQSPPAYPPLRDLRQMEIFMTM